MSSPQDLEARVEKLEVAVLRTAALLEQLVARNAARDRGAEAFFAFRAHAREKELVVGAVKPGRS